MCDIRYFKVAQHDFVMAEHDMLLLYSNTDELALRDVAYHLQQSVEKTLKAYLECAGVTVPRSCSFSKLIDMTKHSGSAAVVTEWVVDHYERLEFWMDQVVQFDKNFCVELRTIQQAIDEIGKFLVQNGLMYTRDPEISTEDEKRLGELVPVAIEDNFELNVYYRIFKKKLNRMGKISSFD